MIKRVAGERISNASQVVVPFCSRLRIIIHISNIYKGQPDTPENARKDLLPYIVNILILIATMSNDYNRINGLSFSSVP